MKKCKDIEDSLPLYSEGLLDSDEKRAVEAHLKSCPACANVFAQLQRSGMMVQDLKDVEPPPWFKQKIMARVRKESEKKNFVQKWFYSLRMKIPVQIMATIVIAVLAVYIYRSGDEQMKAVLPGAQPPVMEAKQEPTPAEMPQTRDKAAALPAEKKAAVTRKAKKDKIAEEISTGGSVPKMEMRENKPAGASDKSPTLKSDTAAEKEEKKYTELPAQQETPQKYAAQQGRMRDRSVEDSSLSGAADRSKSLKAAAPAAPQSRAASVAVEPLARVSLQVVDLNTAVAEAEKILVRYEARIKSRKLLEGRMVMEAEVPGKHWKDVLSKLEGIGQVEEKTKPADSGERYIIVVLEINTR